VLAGLAVLLGLRKAEAARDKAFFLESTMLPELGNGGRGRGNPGGDQGSASDAAKTPVTGTGGRAGLR
jgi:hypothetical protein